MKIMSKLGRIVCRHNPKHRKLLITLEGQYKVYECTRCGKRFNQPIGSTQQIMNDYIKTLKDLRNVMNNKPKSEPLYTQYEEVK